MKTGRPLIRRFTRFGKRLTELRLENNWTQTDAAYLLGVSLRAWQNWEHGSCKPGVFTERALCQLLRIQSID